MNNTFQLSREYSIGELFDCAKIGINPRIYFDIYGPAYSSITELESVWVDESVQVDDEDNEILPKSVIEKGFEYLYSGEMVRMVCQNLMKQKLDAKARDFALALDFYSKNDDFFNFS